MKFDRNIISIIGQFEGCADKRQDGMIYPYLDQVGAPTIGWGTTVYEDGRKVMMGDGPITQDRADELLMNYVEKMEPQIEALLNVQLNQNQFNALGSFTYNCGIGALQTSTLLKRVNVNPADPDIREAFGRWINGWVGGKLVPLPGLIARRSAEADLYFAGV